MLTDKNGNTVDARLRGAIESLLRQLPLQEIDCAVLQSRSPTCGCKQVYDGSFTGKLIPGMGAFARKTASTKGSYVWAVSLV